MVEMIPVDSAMIDSIGYEDLSSTMMIVFRNGHVYEFHLIPRSLFNDFLHSESKGKYFMEKLKYSDYARRVTKRK